MTDGPIEDYQVAFARIEGEVDRGNTDLAALGFWRLVRSVKVEPRLAHHWADVVGRVDRKAFERRHRLRVPVWAGNAGLLLGTVVLAAAIPVALALGRDRPESSLAGMVVVVAAGGSSATVHDLGHWLVGRLAGIRFIAYFVGGPLRLTPGIKLDYSTYLRAPPGARARMHAAGALASKIAPFAMFAGAYLPHRAAGYDVLPAWSLWAVLAIGVGQLVTDALWSTRVSDWKKVRREVAVGRAQRGARL